MQQNQNNEKQVETMRVSDITLNQQASNRESENSISDEKSLNPNPMFAENQFSATRLNPNTKDQLNEIAIEKLNENSRDHLLPQQTQLSQASGFEVRQSTITNPLFSQIANQYIKNLIQNENQYSSILKESKSPSNIIESQKLLDNEQSFDRSTEKTQQLLALIEKYETDALKEVNLNQESHPSFDDIKIKSAKSILKVENICQSEADNNINFKIADQNQTDRLNQNEWTFGRSSIQRSTKSIPINLGTSQLEDGNQQLDKEIKSLSQIRNQYQTDKMKSIELEILKEKQDLKPKSSENMKMFANSSPKHSKIEQKKSQIENQAISQPESKPENQGIEKSILSNDEVKEEKHEKVDSNSKKSSKQKLIVSGLPLSNSKIEVTKQNNQILSNIMSEYHGTAVKSTVFQKKDSPMGSEKASLKPISQSSEPYLLGQNKIQVNITNQQFAKKELPAEIIQNETQKSILNLPPQEAISELVSKYLSLKQQWMEAINHMKDTDTVLQIASQMRGLLGEYIKNNKIEKSELTKIDFVTFDFFFKEKNRPASKILDPSSGFRRNPQAFFQDNLELEYELEKREKIIEHSERQIQKLRSQIDEIEKTAQAKEDQMRTEFEQQIENDRIKMKTAMEEIQSKYLQRRNEFNAKWEDTILKKFDKFAQIQDQVRLLVDENELSKKDLKIKELECEHLKSKINALKIKHAAIDSNTKKQIEEQRSKAFGNETSDEFFGPFKQLIINCKQIIEAMQNERSPAIDTNVKLLNDITELERFAGKFNQTILGKANFEARNLILERELEEANKEIEKIDAVNENLKKKVSILELEVQDFNAKLAQSKSDHGKALEIIAEFEKQKLQAEIRINKSQMEVTQLNDLISGKDRLITDMERIVHETTQKYLKSSKLAKQLHKKADNLREQIQENDIKIFDKKQKDRILRRLTLEIQELKLKLTANLNDQKLIESELENESRALQLTEKKYNDLIKELHRIKAENVIHEEKMKERKKKYKKRLKNYAESKPLHEFQELQKIMIEKDSQISKLTEMVARRGAESRTAKEKIENLMQRFNEKNDAHFAMIAEFSRKSQVRGNEWEGKVPLNEYLILSDQNRDLSNLNEELRSEIRNQYDIVDQLRLKLEKLNVELAKSMENPEFESLKSKVQNLGLKNNELGFKNRGLAEKIESLTQTNNELIKNLELKEKENSRLNDRIKDVEDLLIGSLNKKNQQGFDPAQAVLEIQTLKNQKIELESKVAKLKTLNDEKDIQITQLDMAIQETSRKYGVTVNLLSMVEAKDAQIFEMIIDSNKKQSEIEDLQRKILLLERKLKIGNESRNEKVPKIATKVLVHGEINLTLADYRSKHNISEDIIDKPTELLEVYQMLDIANLRIRKDDEKQIGFREGETESASTGGVPFDGRLINDNKTLKAQIDKYENSINQGNIRDDEFRQRELKLEEQLKSLKQKLESKESTLQDYTKTIGELRAENQDHLTSIKKIKDEIKEQEVKLWQKEKAYLHVITNVNQLNLEANTRNTMFKILESQVLALRGEKDAIRLEKEILEREIVNLNEKSTEGVHNVLFQLNEEKEEHKKNIAKFEQTKAKFLESEKIAKNQSELLAIKSDEIQRLKLIIANQGDRIELLMRIQKLPEESLKELKDNHQIVLDRDLNIQKISLLEQDKVRITAELNSLTQERDELRQSLTQVSEKLAILEKHTSDWENDLTLTRNKIVEKNSILTKMQSEIRELVTSLDQLRAENIKLKLENAEQKDQARFMAKQVDGVYEKLKKQASYCHKGTETETILGLGGENDRIGEKRDENHDQMMRYYKRKLKVRDMKIKHLKESLEMLQKNAGLQFDFGTKSDIYQSTFFEDKQVDSAEIRALKTRIRELENTLEFKTQAENELADLLYEKRTSEAIRNQLFDAAKRETEEYKAKANDAENELYKSQVIMSNYALTMHQMRETKNEYREKINNLKIETQELAQQKEALTTENNNLQIRLEETTVLYNNEISSLTGKIKSLETENQTLNFRNNELNKCIDSKLGENELFAEQIGYKLAEIQEIKQNVGQLKSNLAEMEARCANQNLLDVQLKRVRGQEESLRSLNLAQKTKITELESKIETYKNTIDEQKTVVLTLNNELGDLKNKISKEMDRKEKQNQEAVQVLGATINNQRRIITNNYKGYVNRISNLTATLTKLRQKLGIDSDELDIGDKLNTSIINEEMFEKEQFPETLTGSGRRIEIINLPSSEATNIKKQYDDLKSHFSEILQYFSAKISSIDKNKENSFNELEDCVQKFKTQLEKELEIKPLPKIDVNFKKKESIQKVFDTQAHHFDNSDSSKKELVHAFRAN